MSTDLTITHGQKTSTDNPKAATSPILLTVQPLSLPQHAYVEILSEEGRLGACVYVWERCVFVCVEGV